MSHALYGSLAPYYDLIYAGKDYKSEAAHQVGLIERYKRSAGRDLLEVACGTGRYLEHFEETFACTGLDLNPAMLRIARERAKRSELIEDDMLAFSLGKRFDVVACLFSSIGYVHGVKSLRRAIGNFSDHLQPGGVLLIAPWLTKEEYQVGRPDLQTYVGPDTKLARATVSELKGKSISVLKFNWMIAERNRPVRHIDDDVHELYMFSEAEMIDAMKRAGLDSRFVQRGDRIWSLYVGVAPGAGARGG
ncbi:MAG: class I SAM-dependent methyltransferase [Acidobacteria bacterium]|nr:class I SAM-dependent methyltransferase [Acidobacteriota bacterium]